MEIGTNGREHPLDNAIWNSLNGRHAHLSQGNDLARRYHPDYSPLSGMKDLSEKAFQSLAEIAGANVLGVSFAAEPAVPESWDCFQQFQVSQMVCEKLLSCREHEFEELSDADVMQMRDLVKLTQPGPFASRTHELGTYLGIKDGTRLIAMAGERIKVGETFDEVSAVCTHPDYQGKGYARALVYAVSSLIFQQGHTPFLHVRSDNLSAIKSYQAVGFKLRRNFYFGLLRQKAFAKK